MSRMNVLVVRARLTVPILGRDLAQWACFAGMLESGCRGGDVWRKSYAFGYTHALLVSLWVEVGLTKGTMTFRAAANVRWSPLDPFGSD
jgi:hypothetical protein